MLVTSDAVPTALESYCKRVNAFRNLYCANLCYVTQMRIVACRGKVVRYVKSDHFSVRRRTALMLLKVSDLTSHSQPVIANDSLSVQCL